MCRPNVVSKRLAIARRPCYCCIILIIRPTLKTYRLVKSFFSVKKMHSHLYLYLFIYIFKPPFTVHFTFHRKSLQCHASNQTKAGMLVGVQRIRVKISQVAGQQLWCVWTANNRHTPTKGPDGRTDKLSIEHGRSTVNTPRYRHAHLSSDKYLASTSASPHSLQRQRNLVQVRENDIVVLKPNV